MNTKSIGALAPATSFSPSGSRLFERVRWALRVRNASARTEQAYLAWIRRFVLFHGRRDPAALGELEVDAFLAHLVLVENVGAGTRNQVVAALDLLSLVLRGSEGAGSVHRRRGRHRSVRWGLRLVPASRFTSAP